MPFYRSSPWADAGAYGEGLGNTLAQALIQMPQQRVQNAMQLRQMQLQQQQEAVRNALQQQEQQSLGAYRTAELKEAHDENRARALEYQKQTLIAEKQLQLAQAKADAAKNLAKNGTWRVIKDPETGKSIQHNELLGIVRPLQSTGLGDGAYNLPAGQAGPVLPVSGGGGLSVPLPTGQMQAYATTLGDVGKFINGGTQSNAPSVFNAATNAVPQLIQRIMGAQQQGGGLGAPMANTNAVPGVATNAAAKGKLVQNADGSYNYTR